MYNPEIHHRQSIQLRGFDYSSSEAYFVTICSQGRECLFGGVCDGEMVLNDAGKIIKQTWKTLEIKFPEIIQGEFVIMPNHFHGIIYITDEINRIGCRGESCIRPPLNCQDDMQNQGEHIDQGEHKVRPYGTTAGSVGRVVQAFKSMTTNAYIRGVKQSGWLPFPGRLWQRNYYDRIIRDEKELAAISEYIALNPIRWADDKENQDYAGM